jgi:pimeloyl-ACP methyl ester carboxylesterase
MTDQSDKTELEHGQAKVNPDPPVPAGSATPIKQKPQSLILRVLHHIFRITETLSPELSGRLGYQLWLRPVRFKTPASELEVLSSAEIKFHEIDNHSIATYHWGKSGPTILLVHGWGGRGTQLGEFVKPLVDAGFQVLSFDAPAHGKSSARKTNLYEIADSITALHKIYDDFDSVITHSFGGPCIAIAIQRGLKTKHVISICPPSTTIGLVDKFCEALQVSEKTSRMIKNTIEKQFGEDIWQQTAMVNTVQQLDSDSFESATVIHDLNDTDIPWQEGQAVARAWNDAPFIMTRGLGHRRILRDKSVIDTVVKILKQPVTHSH